MDILLSSLPVGVLVLTLAVLRMAAYRAAACAFAVGLGLAAVLNAGWLGTCGGLVPAGWDRLGAAVLDGVRTGCYPIGLVIVSALFTYAITVESRQIGVIQNGLMHLSSDHRFLALLIVWGFGNFMEGMAGFGTAVAIPCALLVGVGFDPFKAVLCCLVANTTPTAFGSVGVPVMVLASETGLAPRHIAQTAVLLQLGVTALGPFLILLIADGLRGLREKWKLALLCAAAFLAPWVLVSATLGCELPDIAGGLAVLLTLGLVGRHKGLSFREQFRAWLPFGLVVSVLAAGSLLPAPCKVSPGILILGAAFAGGLCLGLSPNTLFALLGRTVWKYGLAVLTICIVLALAKVMGATGMIQTLADALVAATGKGYAFVSPFVGALGGFVTGSGTSSCVLFGRLQFSIGQGAGHSALYVAANVMGAGIGKMICPQSIVLGCAAAGLAGRESEILRKAAVCFLPVIVLAGVLTLLASIVR